MMTSFKHPNISYTREKTADQLAVGDRIKIRNDNDIYKIEKITDRLGTKNFPCLYLKSNNNSLVYDTQLDEPGKKFYCA